MYIDSQEKWNQCPLREEIKKILVSEGNWSLYEVKDIDDFELMTGEIIRECSSYEKDIDSCNINWTYTWKIGTQFEIVFEGSQYLKDQCICDEEYEDGFTIIDVEKEIENAKRIREMSANVMMKKWDTWFEGKTLDEVKSALRTTSFPNTI